MSEFFLACRAKILACRSDMLKPLVDQPAIIEDNEFNDELTQSVRARGEGVDHLHGDVPLEGYDFATISFGTG